MKVVINTCYGGFGLSDAAYEQLHAWGVPIQKYVEQEQDEATGLYKPQPLNAGEVIFDSDLTPAEENSISALYWKYRGISQRYWDGGWTKDRSHSLVLRVVEELGEKANGLHAKLSIVEIPDGTDYEIDEYDGIEHIAEKHRTWR